MPVTIHIPALFRPLVGGRSEVAATGGTVGEVLVQLDGVHPGVLRQIAEDGELRTRLHVFVNGREIRSAQGLQTRVADGDELYLVPSIGGGSRCD